MASLGIAVTAIVLLMMTAAVFWTLHTRRQIDDRATRREAQTVADIVAAAAEKMVADEELSALRRLVVDVSRSRGLRECRITLPDGRIVAHSVPSRITPGNLPPQWPAGPLDADPPETTTDAVAAAKTVIVPGRGALLIEAVFARAREPTVSQEGGIIGLISIGGLSAIWFVYRQLRHRVSMLGRIRDALIAITEGESSREVLGLSGNGGPEERAWNTLLERLECSQQREFATAAGQVMGQAGDPRSELAQAYDSLSLGLVLICPEGRVRHLNGAAASFLNAPREGAVGRPLGESCPEGSVRQALLALLDPNASGLRTREAVCGEGPRQSVLRLHARPLRRQDGRGLLVTIEDITQQRAAESSQNSFVTQATHELRTPLTNMRLCIESAVEDGLKDTAAIEQCLNLLNTETRRLERTVSGMLSVAEIEAGCLRMRHDDVRVDQLLDDLKADFAAPAAAANINLRFDLPPKLPVLQADRDKLMLACHNLVGNALKYTPAGGAVTVVVREDGGRLAFAVTDTGIGIAEPEQDLVFERFYRAQDPRVGTQSGSGLGLTLTREVARLHGGEVSVQSQLNKGSTFTLVLPMAVKAA